MTQKPTTTPKTDHIIDSREEISQIDQSNALGSVESLADQVRHAWEDSQKVKFTAKEKISDVVVAGMGGSGLGIHVIKHLFKDRLTVPLTRVNSYSLPNFIDKQTLVILSSYSGNTEETLTCAEQAISKNCQVIVIAAGGKLAELAKEHHWPIYLIKPEHNPSGCPRLAVGYSIAGLIGLLANAEIFKLENHEIEEAITTILATNEECSVEITGDKNRAKLIAYQCIERRPILVGAEFLTGALHVATNQLNENAKIFADYKLIPEINHHLMEGLRFPRSNPLHNFFFFFDSSLYSKRNQERLHLTQTVVEQNQIETLKIKLTAETPLTQVFELLTLMGYASFYFSIIEGIDPTPNPFVDWFKDQLKK